MENKLTASMIEYIVDQCNKVEYGKVIITLNDTSKTVDISVEQKKKFTKN